MGPLTLMETIEGGTGDWEMTDKNPEFHIEHLNFDIHIRYINGNIKKSVEI